MRLLASREVGVVGVEFYHFGSSSGEKARQKAALEASPIDGHLFPRPTPSPQPTALYLLFAERLSVTSRKA